MTKKVLLQLVHICGTVSHSLLYSLTEIETETEMDIFSLSETERETEMFCKTEMK